jgi:hypothetical protein
LDLCGPPPHDPACVFDFVPAHPSYAEFKAYGGAVANRVYAEDPKAPLLLSRAAKGIGLVIGIAVAGIATALAVVYLTTLSNVLAIIFAGAVFPNAGVPMFAALSASALGIGGIASVIFVGILAIVIAFIGAFQLADFDRIPICLKEDIRIAAGVNVDPRLCADISSQKGRPNLVVLIQTTEGQQEVLLALMGATLPEIDNTATAPNPQCAPTWKVTDLAGTPLPGEGGQVLELASWLYPDGNPTFVEAGLYNGWFVTRTTLGDDTTAPFLTLGIEYVTPDGQQWTAWRSECREGLTGCTPGQAIFILTRNGDEPPTGLNDEEFAEWFAGLSTEITYQNRDGASRIASLDDSPLPGCVEDTPTPTATATVTATPTLTPTPAHAMIHVDRARLSTWRVRRRDNGTLVVTGKLDDTLQGGTLVDRLLAEDFELHVTDSDGSFDVTYPIVNCTRRRSTGLLCGARRARFVMVPSDRRAAVPLIWHFRLRVRDLPDSVTGEPGQGDNPMDAPVTVSLLRAGAIESQTLSDCLQRGHSTLVCWGS